MIMKNISKRSKKLRINIAISLCLYLFTYFIFILHYLYYYFSYVFFLIFLNLPYIIFKISENVSLHVCCIPTLPSSNSFCYVVQIFPWFKIFQTSLIFTFLCLKSITIIRDKEKQKLNWFEKF